MTVTEKLFYAQQREIAETIPAEFIVGEVRDFPFYVFENQPILICRYCGEGKVINEGTNESYGTFVVQSIDGQLMLITADAELQTKISAVDIGKIIRISYLGKVANKTNGFKRKSFRIEYLTDDPAAWNSLGYELSPMPTNLAQLKAPTPPQEQQQSLSAPKLSPNGQFVAQGAGTPQNPTVLAAPPKEPFTPAPIQRTAQTPPPAPPPTKEELDTLSNILAAAVFTDAERAAAAEWVKKAPGIKIRKAIEDKTIELASREAALLQLQASDYPDLGSDL